MDEKRINSQNRLKGTAKFVGLAIKKGYRLCFTHTNSRGVGTADIVVDSDDYVIGCLYEIPDGLLERLDQIEGVPSGAYKRVEKTVTKLNDKLVEASQPSYAVMYVVVNKEENPKTNTEYANHILRGIVTHEMGKPYFEKVKRTLTENNPSIQKKLLDYAQAHFQ